jgi:hypothetical protein
MNRRAIVALTAGILGLTAMTGCNHDGGFSVSKALGWEPKNAVKTPSLTNYPKPDIVVAERVFLVGRQIIAQNTFAGVEPQFHTIGVPESALYHRGSEELFISQGLANKCKTDAELAAVLCSELGSMVAERQAARRAGRDTDPIPDVAPKGNMMAGGIDGDQTRLAELAYHEKRYPRANTNATSTPADAGKVARDLMRGAGYDPAEVDRVAPLLKESTRGEALRKQMAGSASAPSWK